MSEALGEEKMFLLLCGLRQVAQPLWRWSSERDRQKAWPSWGPQSKGQLPFLHDESHLETPNHFKFEGVKGALKGRNQSWGLLFFFFNGIKYTYKIYHFFSQPFLCI